ncbi:SDR family oxidoreductase [Sneathiella sp.]|uniref:SDR family oxidoreductase n=1 Tax=Sneathiella sp. TaxID=1964365 RepID=UPI003561D4EA
MNTDLQTVIITGANRGIGLALVERFLASGVWRVLACCRAPDQATALQKLAREQADRIELFALDVTDSGSAEHFAWQINGRKVDVLLNNAGVKGGDHQTALDMDFDAWEEALQVNTLAPLRMVQAVIGNLRLSTQPKIITISSQMGALSRKGSGSYAYSSSKAAVNKVMQILASDLQADGFIVCLYHPGWVQTDMGGKSATISPEESANGLFSSITALTRTDNGRFLKWNGEEHPW